MQNPRSRARRFLPFGLGLATALSLATACGTAQVDALAEAPTTRAALATSVPDGTHLTLKGLAGKCLDVSGASTADGAKVQLWDCNQTVAQAWTYSGGQLVGPGGKCLDITWSDATPGTKVQLFTCNGTAAQQWSFQTDLTLRGLGECLDISGANPANGTQAIIWGCHGQANQQWTPVGAPTRGEQSRPADSFVDSIGVNTHSGWSDTIFAQRARWISMLHELGVRHVRDAPDASAYGDLAAAGVRVDFLLDPRDSRGISDTLSYLKANNMRPESFEGPNEFDSAKAPWAANWQAEVRQFQQQLFQAVRSDSAWNGVPVVGPSPGGNAGDRTGYGDLTPWLDFGNIHSYPGAYPPENNLNDQFRLASVVSGSKAIFATETGYHNALADPCAPNTCHNPISEQGSATYLPRVFLEYYRRGVIRTFSYELLNNFYNPADLEQNFGLIRNDFSPKPAYWALKNLIGLLSDPGQGFNPGALDYVVASSAPSDLQHVLLQKRDGTFFLVLWRTGSAWDVNTRTDLYPSPANVTLNFAHSVNTTLFQPNGSANPVSNQNAVSSVTVPVGVQVVVLKVGVGA